MSVQMDEKVFNILLVDDDEDDFRIIRDTLSRIRGTSYQLDWMSGYEDALNTVKADRHYDVCLMDYRLGSMDGIGLMKELIAAGFQAPVIILTGYGDYDIDVQALKEGAFDYLEKGKLSPEQLEHAIRYAVEKWLMLTELKKSENKVRMLSSKVIGLQEKERKLIARELHDSIGANLTAIKFALEAELAKMKKKQPSEDISLEHIIRMVRGTMEEARRLSYNLRPGILDDFGLIPAVHSMIKDFQGIYRDIFLEPDIRISEESIPEDLKIIIYRIVQESLNNVSKHSGADRVWIFLGRTPHGLEMTLRDNGCGFRPEQTGPDHNQRQGMGLEGMRERVEFSDGKFQCISGPNKGTTIRAVWCVEK